MTHGTLTSVTPPEKASRIPISTTAGGSRMNGPPATSRKFVRFEKPRIKLAFDGLMSELDRDAMEERAAICEYDGGLSRDHAEQLAALHTVALPEGLTEAHRDAFIDAVAKLMDCERAPLSPSDRLAAQMGKETTR